MPGMFDKGLVIFPMGAESHEVYTIIWQFIPKMQE